MNESHFGPCEAASPDVSLFWQKATKVQQIFGDEFGQSRWQGGEVSTTSAPEGSMIRPEHSPRMAIGAAKAVDEIARKVDHLVLSSARTSMPGEGEAEWRRRP